jgi:acetoin utilization deacetylase AcuC-like enzyme
MTFSAIWSEGSLLHDPDGEVWIGMPIDGDETPDRGWTMKAAVDRAGLEVAAPVEHPDSAITAVHDPGMLSYLRTAHEEWVSAGYPEEHGQDHVVAYAWPHPGAFGHLTPRVPASRAARAGLYCMDTCTTLGPGSYRGIRYAVDAALTAADLVIGGQDAAYAAVRPPGHHAGTDYFGGSCYLNNAAITAQYLRDAGVGRIGIIDIDAHHGNGTQQVFYERDDVFYMSVHVDPGMGWYPHWSGFAEEIGDGSGKGFTHNLPLAPGNGDGEVAAAVEELAALVTGTGCDALIVSLGVDSGAADENSPLEVTAEGFAQVGRILGSVGLPTVLVQEGGYDLAALERDLTAVLTGFGEG